MGSEGFIRIAAIRTFSSLPPLWHSKPDHPGSMPEAAFSCRINSLDASIQAIFQGSRQSADAQ
jgi:hypothetical protein